jgi:transcriptional regulator with XRE-family HTH domain
MSQGNLADKLDVSRQTISKWENNMCLPEAEKLLQLSEIFGVSIDYILKGKTIVEPEPVYIYVKDPESENASKYNESLIRKYLGTAIAILGGFISIIFALEPSLSILLFITVPLTILGILMARNAKHPWLIVSWITYVPIMCLLTYGTSISPLYFFMGLYECLVKSVNIFASPSTIISFFGSLACLILFVILILLSIKAKRGYIFRPKDNS